MKETFQLWLFTYKLNNNHLNMGASAKQKFKHENQKYLKN